MALEERVSPFHKGVASLEIRTEFFLSIHGYVL